MSGLDGKRQLCYPAVEHKVLIHEVLRISVPDTTEHINLNVRMALPVLCIVSPRATSRNRKVVLHSSSCRLHDSTCQGAGEAMTFLR